MISIGQVLNDTYEITGQLGAGGGGIIYKAFHIRMRKEVAIKLIKNNVKNEAFNRSEVDMLKDLKNDYLPQVIDFVEDGDDVYTVMEFIEGKNFKQLIESGVTFSEKQVRKYAIQLCQAVKYLHSHTPPIIHSDIKPSNIMLTPEDRICLIDFNISTISDKGVGASKGGSRDFGAPEQFRRIIKEPITVDDFHEETRFIGDDETELLMNGESMPRKSSLRNTPNTPRAYIDVRTDIFGIGASLYYILTGRVPHGGRADFSMIRCSRSISNTIKKAMDPDPAKRFINVSKLEASLKGSGRIKKVIVSALAAAAVAVGGFAFVTLSENSTSPAEEFVTIKGQEYSTYLTSLDLSGMELTDEDIKPLSKMKNLTYLDLRGNQISNISALKNLTNLEELVLYNNQISDISALKKLQNLNKLNLSKNQISNIKPLSQLTNLTELRLFNNQISDISSLSGLENLTSLVLASNQISDISPVSRLENLTSLNLRGNQISDISPLSGLTDLGWLSLSNNQISKSDINELEQALPDCNIDY